MTTAFQHPKQGDVDLLGREYSDICGFSKDPLVLIGSVVTLLPGRFRAGQMLFDKYLFLQRCVVVGHDLDLTWRNSPEKMLVLRLLDHAETGETRDLRAKWDARHVLVESVGTGEAPQAGRDYPLSLQERWDAKFKARDHTFEGFTNAATHLAHLYLRTNSKHFTAVCAMVRGDGTVNPVRLENYFFKQPDLVLDDWALYPFGFPERSEYRYAVNWAEVAGQFNLAVKEEREFAEA